jgi:hypothetical protein
MAESHLQKSSQKSKTKSITQERLKELLHYNPATGFFSWKVQKAHRVKIGSRAGCSLSKDGYRRVRIDGILHLESRLAWLYCEGYLPEHEIDHRNRICGDNRIKNLRVATRRCNTRNCGIRSDNVSGVTGVSWDKARKKWRADIMVDQKSVSIGRFKFFIDAVKARWNGEVQHGFPNCNTTSSAFLFLQGEV